MSVIYPQGSTVVVYFQQVNNKPVLFGIGHNVPTATEDAVDNTDDHTTDGLTCARCRVTRDVTKADDFATLLQDGSLTITATLHD